MSIVIKPIIYGCLLTVGLGIIGYLAVLFYHILVLGLDDPKILADIMRSNRMMWVSIPYTFVVVLASVLLVIKRLPKYQILVASIIVIITAASITFGPLKIASIHMNYLPIVLGGLIGALVGTKLNRSRQDIAGEADTAN